MSIGAFSSSDFTMTNTALSGSNIQLGTYASTSNQYFANPSGGGNSIFALYQLSSSLNLFCSEKNGIYYTHTIAPSTSNQNNAPAVNYASGTSWYFWSYNNNYVTSITCSVPSTAQYTSGSLVQTTPTTTTQPYDTLNLNYTQTLNGGTITPILIINGIEQTLTNNELTGTFPTGTNISVKFSLTGSSSTTPQINNNIVLTGSYTPPVVASSSSNVSSNSLSKSNVLSVLSSANSKPSLVSSSSHFNILLLKIKLFLWGIFHK